MNGKNSLLSAIVVDESQKDISEVSTIGPDLGEELTSTEQHMLGLVYEAGVGDQVTRRKM